MLTALKSLLISIGRWVLTHVIDRGRSALIHYMEGKVDDFKRRLAKAKTARRRKWLKGRISRWNKVIAWMKANADKFGINDFKTLRTAMKAKVPLVSPAEEDVADAA